jgi:TrkA-N domain
MRRFFSGANPLPRWLFFTWIGLIVGSFSVGTVGFLYQTFNPPEDVTLFDAFYRSFQLFLGAGGAIPKPCIPIEIARVLSPLLSATVFLRWFLVAQARRTQPPLPTNHVVICGLGVMGRRFAEQFHKHGNQVVILERNHTNESISWCLDKGMQVVIGDAADPGILQQVNVKHANLVLGLADEATNLHLRDNLRFLVKRRNRESRDAPLRCFLHLVDERKLAPLRLASLRSSRPRHDIHSASATLVPLEVDGFNMYELSATLMLNISGHAFLAPGRITSPIRQLAFVGWDQWNQALLLEAVRRWQQSDHWRSERIKLSIFIAHEEGRDLKELWKKFVESHKILENICDFSGTSIRDFTPQLNAESILFISLEHDAKSVVFSDRLYQAAGGFPCPVVVAIRQSWEPDSDILPDRTNRWVHKVQDEACMPKHLSGTCERIGQRIHEYYLGALLRRKVRMGSRPAMKLWDELDSDYKSSSIRQAASIENNVSKSGIDLLLMDDVDLAAFEFTPREVEDIARREHKRYCEERTVQGPSEKPGDWDRLDDEPKTIALEMVQAWPAILALFGFGFRRRK